MALARLVGEASGGTVGGWSRTCAGSVEQGAGVSLSPEGNRRLGPRHVDAGAGRVRLLELAADCAAGSGARDRAPGR